MDKSIDYYTKTELKFDANNAADPYFNEMNKWSYCGKILVHKENYKYLIQCDICQIFFYNNCSFLIHLRETHSHIFDVKENYSNQTTNKRNDNMKDVDKSSLEKSTKFNELDDVSNNNSKTHSQICHVKENDNQTINMINDNMSIELDDDSNNNSENNIFTDKEKFSPSSSNSPTTTQYYYNTLSNEKKPTRKENLSQGLPPFIPIDGIYKCPDCPLKFKASESTKQHYWLKHTYQYKIENENDVPSIPKDIPNPDDNYYHCTGCLARYKEYKTLMYHFKKHPGACNIKNRPHKCATCTSSFWTKQNLESHVLVHTGNRKYKCELCSRSFLRAVNLKLHLRDHTNIKPLKCNFCDKRFLEKCYRKYHELAVHLNSRPHKCDICGNSYNKRIILAAHMRRHTGERPAVCKICDSAFYDKDSLRRHSRTHKEKKIR